MSADGAPYAPFMEPRTARPPGLSPLDPTEWVACDPDCAEQLAERDRLLAERPDEMAQATADAGPALAEFRDALLAHLSERPEWEIGATTARRPDGVALSLDLPTLTLAGRLCQEDFLLMAPDAPEYRLVAGVLCFPSRWSLSEKLGRQLTRIHRPVPDYAETLAARINRVFDAIRVDRPLIRANWLVHATDRLDLPQREDDKGPSAHGDRFFLRTERQTLRRLPETGVVVFGVKTTVTPVEDLTAPQREALQREVSAWSAGEIAYRGGAQAWREALAALAQVNP